MDWTGVSGPLVGGILALAGVAVTQWFTARRERKNRNDAHLSRLVDKRYELYLDYLTTMEENANIFVGENWTNADADEVLERLVKHGLHLQVFASQTVLGAMDEYRDVMRRLGNWDNLEVADRGELARELDIVSAMVIQAVRADLKIDSYESPWMRFRYRQRVKRTMLSRMDNINAVAVERVKRWLTDQAEPVATNDEAQSRDS
ncbi:hypothetical protein [Amycolatopsis thermoflava]|uniref:hypothetical protein n=1 Tax=Amycolatopsis thermoflava TaxID=84480 RepID=UPI003653B026